MAEDYLEWLPSRQAELDDGDGKTALELAIECIEAGADVNFKFHPSRAGAE